MIWEKYLHRLLIYNFTDANNTIWSAMRYWIGPSFMHRHVENLKILSFRVLSTLKDEISSFICRWSNLDRPIIQSVVRHCTYADIIITYYYGLLLLLLLPLSLLTAIIFLLRTFYAVHAIRISFRLSLSIFCGFYSVHLSRSLLNAISWYLTSLVDCISLYYFILWTGVAQSV
jgi:hypothetical protein